MQEWLANYSFEHPRIYQDLHQDDQLMKKKDLKTRAQKTGDVIAILIFPKGKYQFC